MIHITFPCVQLNRAECVVFVHLLRAFSDFCVNSLNCKGTWLKAGLVKII
jgi:hypothetical protein